MKTYIIGGFVTIVGIILLIYGDSQNRNLMNQISSIINSGQTNPGTPWMIFGGIFIGIGVIIFLVKLLNNKE